MAEQVGRDDPLLCGERVDQVVPVAVRAQQAMNQRDSGPLTCVDIVQVAAVQCCGHRGARVWHRHLLKLLDE